MDKLSDNYYNRKYYLEEAQVPTQTIMKKTMSPALADIYFSSMTPKLKVIAGLAPPLLGSRDPWFQPSDDILKGKTTLKPLPEQHAKLLCCNGIYEISGRLLKYINRKYDDKIQKALNRLDRLWKMKIVSACKDELQKSSNEAAEENSKMIRTAYKSFAITYRTSMLRLEEIFMTAALHETEKLQTEMYNKIHEDFKNKLKQQALHLHNIHADKLREETERIKLNFIRQVEESRADMTKKIHDMRVERFVIVEKLRQLIESQKLACQIYVALKEHEECGKEIEQSQHVHKKKLKKINEQLTIQDFEVRLEQEKESIRLEFIRIWQKKVCQVVKRFQMFVTFCLSTLPEYAEFFIDMEKLMLLQMSEAFDVPANQSVIEVEPWNSHTPVPKPHPYYLCCDKGNKPAVDQDLCPKHCSSSASQMPVVVVNKRCVYSKCDNFSIFSEKLQQFLDGRGGDDEDFNDDHTYGNDIPVKITSSQQLLELTLESSILQILKNEIPHAAELPITCPCCCNVPHCFPENKPHRTSRTSMNPSYDYKHPSQWAHSKAEPVVTPHEIELKFAEKPPWASYLQLRHPKECRDIKCPQSVHTRLDGRLPAYMRQLPRYVTQEIPGYVMCNADALIQLVKKSHGVAKAPPRPLLKQVKDASTQYSDQNVDLLCTYFSENEVDKILEEIIKNKAASEKFNLAGDGVSSSFLYKHPFIFAEDRGMSFLSLLDKSSDLKQMFMKRDCTEWND